MCAASSLNILGSEGVFLLHFCFRVFFKDQRDPFVLTESPLHKSVLVAKRDNPTRPVTVFSQEFAYKRTGACSLHCCTYPVVLWEGGTGTVGSRGPWQE